MVDPNDYHVSTVEVAKTMGLTAAAVRQWCEDGTIPAIRAGVRKRWCVRNDWMDVLRARLADQRQLRAGADTGTGWQGRG